MKNTVEKPVVRYSGKPVVYSFGDHQVATVTVVDHPRFDAFTEVTTSAVLDFNESSGRIETRNTIYVKEGSYAIKEQTEGEKA